MYVVIKSASSDQNLRSVTFLHHFGIGSLQINLFLKQTGIRVTKTARNVHFGNLKFTWKWIHAQNVFFYLFLEIKKTACYLCDMLNNLF